MSTSTQPRDQPAGPSKQSQPTPAVSSTRSIRTGDSIDNKAWVAKAAKQPMVLETAALGPLGAEDVEVAVEYCGLCHSDLSVLNNEALAWLDAGKSHYRIVLDADF